MFAETLVAGMNAFFLLLLGVINVAGTLSMLNLAATLLKKEPRRSPAAFSFSVEDA